MARIWPPACDRAAAHLAGRERELTLTLAAAAGRRLGAEARKKQRPGLSKAHSTKHMLHEGMTAQ
jgi:hypothetical protein